MACGASALAIILSLSVLPTVACAQTTDSAENVGNAEIIVSARRREEKLQDVPVVVTAIQSEAIEKLNLRDAKELVALVPGLDLRSDGYAASIQLRGLQYNVNTGATSSVATYLNDAPIQARAVLSQLYDIGQVEVLHGPQGTLRGQAAPSGSITFTTKKPDLQSWGGYVSGTLANAHSYNVNGALNLPIIKDMLGIRVAGVWDKNEGNRVHSISPNATFKDPFAEEKGARVSVLFKPTDWLRLEGSFQTLNHDDSTFNQYASYNLVDSTGAASPTLIRPEDRLSIQDTPNVQHQQYHIWNWRGEVRFAGQKLIYQGSRYYFNNRGVGNQDAANYIPKVDVYQTNLQASGSETHEVRLQNESRVAGIFDYVLGYFHIKSPTAIHVEQQIAVTLPPFLGSGLQATIPVVIDTLAPNGGPLPPTYETSFFGNVTAHIGDKLEISGGLRHIKNTQGAADLFISVSGGAPSVTTFGTGTNDQKWIYSASVKYNITPDAMVYFSTGTSHRAGPTIFNQALLQSPLELAFRQLPPEDSTSYELGFRTQWLDRRITLNVTGFHQTFKNYPFQLTNGVYYINYDFTNGAFVPKPDNSSQWGAAVPVTINGVDVEFGWKVSRRFEFSAVATYSDSNIKNGIVPCNDLNGDHVADTVTAAPTVAQLQAAYGANNIGSCTANFRATNQAPFSATLQAEYNAPIGNKMEMFARGLLNYYGPSRNDDTQSFDNIGSYALLNLYLGLRAPDRAWELTFYGKNVFNNSTYTRFNSPASTSVQELAPPTFRTTVGKAYNSTYSQISTVAPREFGVNLKIAFGSR